MKTINYLIGNTNRINKSLLFFVSVLLAASSFGQNTFPSSGKVGIGTTSPQYQLHVYKSGTKARFEGPDGYIDFGPMNPQWAHIYTDRPKFIFNKDIYSITGGFSSYSPQNLRLKTMGTTRMTIENATGDVGIGTTNPLKKLDVRGSLLLEAGTDPGLFTGTGSAELNRFLLIMNSPSHTSASGLKAGGILVSDSYAYANPGKNNLIVKGDVGIGTANPNGYKLAVNGKIRAKEVVVETNWADFVFKPNYQLKTLPEVEQFIKTNGHLPDIPSEADVKENGVSVGEINSKLLQKIEELTLYVIELNKENEEQYKRLLELESKTD